MTAAGSDQGADEGLATRTLGEAGPRVVFVHGLFGQGKNWTTIGKGLADGHRVTLVDLPNHGHSPWTDRVDYLDMVELLAGELEQFAEPVTLVGHSMGGKVAMQLALRRPELLRALVSGATPPSSTRCRAAGPTTRTRRPRPSPPTSTRCRSSTWTGSRPGTTRMPPCGPPSRAGWCAASCCRAWSGRV